MSHIFDWVFSQYHGVPIELVVWEIIAIIFGLLSVWYSKRENILVYPTGIISTAIYVYLLIVYQLLGDMLINAYYFTMSIYGWYQWTRKIDQTRFIPITRMTRKEYRMAGVLFVSAIALVVVVYELFDKWQSWFSYVDILTTAIFFVGMWLMAKKKLENWTYWIIGDIISIPLYLLKGMVLSSFLYATLTIIAIYGYIAWKKNLNKSPERLLK